MFSEELGKVFVSASKELGKVFASASKELGKVFASAPNGRTASEWIPTCPFLNCMVPSFRDLYLTLMRL